MTERVNENIKPPKILTIKAGNEVMYVMPLGFLMSDGKAKIVEKIVDDTVRIGSRRRGKNGKEECCLVHHFMTLKGIPVLEDLESDSYKMWEADFIPMLFAKYWKSFQEKLCE